VALAAIWLVALSAREAAGGAIAAGSGSPRGAGAVGASIDWGPCKPRGPRLQCARVREPLDWDHPNGRKIHLAVVRHLASKPKQRIGSMFFNPGGPGESGVELVRDNGAELDAWGGGRFNLVGWDPRGTNASTPVPCFTSTASEARFWRGVQIATTAAASRVY
jgi:pimeloyl-ACP methyl ester carboxylesterase